MLFLHRIYQKTTWKQRIFAIVLICCVISSIVFVYHNHSLYKNSIAEVVEMTIDNSVEVKDIHQNKDVLYTQQIIAEVKNGHEKGLLVHLTNEFSESQAFDQKFEVGSEIFISVNEQVEEVQENTGTITGVKRDKYLVIIAWVFIFVLLLIGKKQGLLSVIGLAFNAMLLWFALDIYIDHANQSLLWICGVSIILFTVVSLLLVNGVNEKTFAAIIATLIGTFSSLLITYIALVVTGENGLRYEELQFITRPYKIVFLAGIFIGSLGAVMDVSITMSTSIFGLYEKDPTISVKDLTKSGMEIGKDIMGTMTNILFFAYVSGSIPTLLLYFKNSSTLGYTLSMNLSLELVRALTGGIGIVITIPIGLYTAIFFVKRRKAKL
ncbi:YibE/F family protein [Psychrobacillus sp. MER TA 171]|uniref:YibE/F family protein n=1 Tax=Psychrobacillus sp. MER TA 171 TaxID=2939577 RepID=UPI00203E08AF|nr:YibE/F family protein [Psychrobacillus sp. MER TA 171]MCM3358282.1 YibE/F family protein [Psychrobacillus sp. MER TA 171]